MVCRPVLLSLALVVALGLAGCGLDDGPSRPERRGGRGGGGLGRGAGAGRFGRGEAPASRNQGPGRERANFSSAGSREPLAVAVESGVLRFSRGGLTVMACRTAGPKIEKWAFWKGTEQVAVRSRGANGVVLELFEMRTGARVGTFRPASGGPDRPAWAASVLD